LNFIGCNETKNQEYKDQILVQEMMYIIMFDLFMFGVERDLKDLDKIYSRKIPYSKLINICKTLGIS
jgi:hypothetical protein